MEGHNKRFGLTDSTTRVIKVNTKWRISKFLKNKMYRWIHNRKSNIMIFSLLILNFVSFVWSFNLEPRIAIVKEGLPGTYFGFSVAQHQIISKDQIESVLLVGAPLARYPSPTANRWDNKSGKVLSKASGVLYKCPFTSKNRDCKRVKDVPSAKSPQRLHEAGGQWLGVVVNSQGPGMIEKEFKMSCKVNKSLIHDV